MTPISGSDSHKNTGSINTMSDFFWFCSGADPDVLARCPKSEKIKHAAIGATVFFTGLLAMISGGYALYFTFNSVFIAIAFGVFWGLLIFNLDRLIVATLKKDSNKFREFMYVLPRLGLALIIAIVISKPLELKLFETEINAELVKMNQEKVNEANQLIGQNPLYTQMELIRGEISALQNALAAKQEQRDELYQEYIGEAEGSAGTGLRGKGPVFREKVTQYNRIEKELKDLKSVVGPQIAERQGQIDALSAKLAEEIDQKQPIIQANTGLSARLTALDRLQSPASLFIMLLFVALECAPVLTKFIIGKGPYDHIFKNNEHRIEAIHQEEIHNRTEELNKKTAINDQVNTATTEQEIKSHTTMMDSFYSAQKEIMQASINNWLQAERDRLHKGNNGNLPNNTRTTGTNTPKNGTTNSWQHPVPGSDIS